MAIGLLNSIQLSVQYALGKLKLAAQNVHIVFVKNAMKNG